MNPDVVLFSKTLLYVGIPLWVPWAENDFSLKKEEKAKPNNLLSFFNQILLTFFFLLACAVALLGKGLPPLFPPERTR